MKHRIYVVVAVDVEVPDEVDDTEAVPDAIREADTTFVYHDPVSGVQIVGTEIVGTDAECPIGPSV